MLKLELEKNRKRYSDKQQRRKDKANLWKKVVLKNSIIPKKKTHHHHKPKLQTIRSVSNRDETVVAFIDTIQEYVRCSTTFDLEDRLPHVTMFLKNVLNETNEDACIIVDSDPKSIAGASSTLLASSSESAVVPSTASSSTSTTTLSNYCRRICCSSELELSSYYATRPLRLGCGRIPSTSEDLADLLESVLYARLQYYTDREMWFMCLMRLVYSVGIDKRREILAKWGLSLFGVVGSVPSAGRITGGSFTNGISDEISGSKAKIADQHKSHREKKDSD